MRGPREVLNELKWREGYDLSHARVHYVHRGAPGDTRIVAGSAIRGLHASFLELEGPRGGSWIPYHRVFRVEYIDRVLWERAPTAGAPGSRREAVDPRDDPSGRGGAGPPGK